MKDDNKLTMNTKAKEWFIVINPPKEIEGEDTTSKSYLEEVLSFASSCFNFTFFAGIIHDKDIAEDGEAKKLHCHILVSYDTKATKRALFDDIKEHIHDMSDEQISARPVKNITRAIQYLTHQNEPNKAQYSDDLIKTTNEDFLRQQLALKLDNEDFKKDSEIEIEDMLECNGSMIEFAKRFGVNRANKLRGIFNQVSTESRQDYKSLREENDYLRITIKNIGEDLRKLQDTTNESLRLSKEQREYLNQLFQNLFDDLAEKGIDL